jgi:hypothetical protein
LTGGVTGLIVRSVNEPPAYSPLPSDGVPHVVADDGPADTSGCRCTDCRVARETEIEAAILRHNARMAEAMSPAVREIVKSMEAPTKKRRRGNR